MRTTLPAAALAAWCGHASAQPGDKIPDGQEISDGTVRIGLILDMYLFEVKTPAESKGPWDLYERLATIPGDEAFQPLSASRCPLVKQ